MTVKKIRRKRNGKRRKKVNISSNRRGIGSRRSTTLSGRKKSRKKLKRTNYGKKSKRRSWHKKGIKMQTMPKPMQTMPKPMQTLRRTMPRTTRPSPARQMPECSLMSTSSLVTLRMTRQTRKRTFLAKITKTARTPKGTSPWPPAAANEAQPLRFDLCVKNMVPLKIDC